MTRYRDGNKILTTSGNNKKARVKWFYSIYHRTKRKDMAISQIIGTTLLLLIAVAMMAMVYSYFLSYPLPNPTAQVEIMGNLRGENVELLHSGGERLKLDTVLAVNIGSSTYNTTVGKYLDSQSKNDGFWNIGESLIYPVGDTTGKKLGVTIADKESYSIIFEAWFKETFSDTAVFSVEIGKEGNMICIPGTLNVIVVYADKDNDGWLTTFQLEEDGSIAATLDTLEFDSGFCFNPNLVHITGDIYAICYKGLINDGTIKTVQIASNGSINGTMLDTLVFDTFCNDPDIIHVSENILAIAYGGMNDDGFLKTIEILSDGDITAVVDALEFDTTKATAPNIIRINDDIYAIVYSGLAFDGFLVTVEIATDGDISGSVNDTLVFDAVIGIDPAICHVSGDIYTIVYEGLLMAGYMKTVEIWDNGDINNTVIDSKIFDVSKGQEPEIIRVGGNTVAVAYSGNADIGNLITSYISNNGTIVNPTIDSFKFTDYCKSPRILHVSEHMYTISYRGLGNEGYVATVFIANNGNIY